MQLSSCHGTKTCMKIDKKENERLVSAGMVAMKQPVDEEVEDG